MADASSKIIGLVVGFVIALIVIAFLLPVGIEQFYNANWSNITGIDPAVSNMISVIIPVMVVLGIILAVITAAVKLRGRD